VRGKSTLLDQRPHGKPHGLGAYDPFARRFHASELSEARVVSFTAALE
jgi:hypothetical protein